MTQLLTAKEYESAVERIIETAQEVIPTEVVRLKVSEWAEEHRTLAEGMTPYPGPFSFDIIPYQKEIVDCLSESSPVREIAVMKGTQIAFTVAIIENWIGYTIGTAPAPMLYVTGDAGLADTQMEVRVDSMIDNSGIAHKIGAQSKRVGQRKTGDVKTRKEFPGGFLVAAGPNSGAKLRSMSFKKINVDEVDAFPDSTGKEGDPIYLIRRRVDAFTESYKIAWGSTPLFEHNSKILRLYREGDQRKYFVPCKHCGHMQFLRWGKKDEKGGLKFDHDEDDRLVAKFNKDGQIVSSSVRYQCEKCGGEWKNADKDWFLPRGEWRPTAKPRRPGMRSYHIPGLLSPVGFRSWESAVVEFLQIKHEGFPPMKFQNWVNTFLGEPFEDRGERPKIEALLTRERRYHIDTLPEDAQSLIVTIGADLQKDRIECEIVAWGRNFESWSINYHVIHGDTVDPDDPCWEAMRAIIQRKYSGMQPAFTGIDAGFRTDIVYDFCDSFDSGVFPVMGSDQTAKAREYTRLAAISGRTTPRIDINTDVLKQELYKNLSKGLPESGQAPRGYCHFPIEYSREHFNRLTAEQRLREVNAKGVVTYRWDAGGRRNEQLDARVYATAMLYAYHRSLQDAFHADGTLQKEEHLTWEAFWNYVENTR